MNLEEISEVGPYTLVHTDENMTVVVIREYPGSSTLMLWSSSSSILKISVASSDDDESTIELDVRTRSAIKLTKRALASLSLPTLFSIVSAFLTIHPYCII
jgi:hypothetical protein